MDDPEIQSDYVALVGDYVSVGKASGDGDVQGVVRKLNRAGTFIMRCLDGTEVLCNTKDAVQIPPHQLSFPHVDAFIAKTRQELGLDR